MQFPRQHRKDGKTDVPAGNDSTTAECYRRYALKLFAYLCRHIQSANDAEDMLFEIFLVVLEHERRLETMLEDEQRAWLWTVARNRVIDYHRWPRRRRMVPLEHLAEMIDHHSTPDEI